MKKPTSSMLLGMLALLSYASASMPAAVTLTPLNATTLQPQNTFLPGDQVVIDVSGTGFPAGSFTTGVAGASLKVSFDASKVTVVSPASGTGFFLAPGSPFTAGIYVGNTFASCGIPVASCSAAGPGDVVSVLGPLSGISPGGSFDAFRIRFKIANSASLGLTTIALDDDQADLSWTDASTFGAVPVTYTQANLNIIPVPPDAFLFPSALAALGWVRRRPSLSESADFVEI